MEKQDSSLGLGQGLAQSLTQLLPTVRAYIFHVKFLGRTLMVCV